ncbi:MAG: hypothetical protein LBB38_01545 [Puniceicoccales bacterium]|nr:hypothetical protein [Puniceicoccales bacterium]
MEFIEILDGFCEKFAIPTSDTRELDGFYVLTYDGIGPVLIQDLAESRQAKITAHVCKFDGLEDKIDAVALKLLQWNGGSDGAYAAILGDDDPKFVVSMHFYYDFSSADDFEAFLSKLFGAVLVLRKAIAEK